LPPCHYVLIESCIGALKVFASPVRNL